MTEHNGTFTTSTGVHCIVEGCVIGEDGRHSVQLDTEALPVPEGGRCRRPRKTAGASAPTPPTEAPAKPRPEPTDETAEAFDVAAVVDTTPAVTDPGASDIVDVIRAMMQERPREPMGNIGPSMLGGCERKMGHQLAFGSDGARGDGSWIARVGTAVHVELAEMFKGRVEADGTRRWFTDLRITRPVRGVIDVLDTHRREVVDFKVVGATTLAKARRGEVDAKYDVQLDVYALGLILDGHTVERVAILFLPKTQGLDKAVWYSRPVDLARAVAAVERLRRVETVVRIAVDAGGAAEDYAAALAELSTTEDFCRECPALAAGFCQGPPPKIERCPEWPAWDAVLESMEVTR